MAVAGSTFRGRVVAGKERAGTARHTARTRGKIMVIEGCLPNPVIYTAVSSTQVITDNQIFVSMLACGFFSTMNYIFHCLQRKNYKCSGCFYSRDKYKKAFICVKGII